MRKLLLVTGCFSFLVLGSSQSFAQHWCWGRDGRVNIKANYNNAPVATNRFGNAYITGGFNNVIIFGLDTLFEASDNMYVVKYDVHGNVLWAKNPISAGTSYGNAVVSDANDNAYITGSSNSTIIFGTDTLKGNGFFVKYSPNGQVLWAKSISGISLAMDKNGNICLATNDSLMKFNPNGNRFMSRSISYPGAIATDNSLNIYTTAYRDTLIGSGIAGIPFLTKYDSGGNFLWERQPVVASAFLLLEGYGYSAITDNSGNVYYTGFFQDTLYFGPYTLMSPFKLFAGSNQEYALFLAKYDKNGKLIWAKQTQGIHDYRGTSLAEDKNDYIYLGGSGIAADTLLFGGGMLTLPTTATDVSFILKLDTAGALVSGSLLRNGTITQTPRGYANEIAVDSSGNYCFLTGTFKNDTIICAGDTLDNGSGSSGYIAKWNQNECIYTTDNITPVTTPNSSVPLFPNPNNGTFTIQANSYQLMANSQIEIYNVLGEKVHSEILRSTQAYYHIILNQPKGIYLYRVIAEDGSLLGSGKVVIDK